MTKQNVSTKDIIQATLDACEGFSECSDHFFNFDKRDGYLGWENWLTIDIFRRLNHRSVVPFEHYSNLPGINSKEDMDLYIGSPNNIAVEIKVNYLGVEDLDKNNKRKLPKRVMEDISKLKKIGDNYFQLLLLAMVFEKGDQVDRNVIKYFDEKLLMGTKMNYKIYECFSHSKKHDFSLLVLSNADRLANIDK